MIRNIVLEGKFVRLEEISPKYFSKVIEWRNNPENNKFLNQPFKLTMELQKKWYEEKYLNEGFYGYISKPFTKEEMNEKLAKVLKQDEIL